jgi:hypothetical protein
MTVIFLQRTFTSLVHAHVGRTQVTLADRLRRWRSFGGGKVQSLYGPKI